ncbi:MAG: hypothetical protein ACYDCQ_15830 [Dehalococcoidia bacterium]
MYENDEPASAAWLLARLLLPVTALLVAAGVLFGSGLPSSGGRSSAAGTTAGLTATASAVVAEPSQPPTPAPTPFVLRPTTIIDTSSTPVPGSAAAQAALTPPCIALQTGHAPNGDIIRDGIYQMLGRQHPECP